MYLHTNDTYTFFAYPHIPTRFLYFALALTTYSICNLLSNYTNMFTFIDLKIHVRGLRLQLCGMSHRQLEKSSLLLYWSTSRFVKYMFVSIYVALYAISRDNCIQSATRVKILKVSMIP